MAAALSLCPSLTPKLSQNKTPTPLSLSRTSLQSLSQSLFSLTLNSRKQPTLSFTAKSTDTKAAVSLSEPETEKPESEDEPVVEVEEPKPEEVFAVVMITLNKVLLVGTKTSTYIGKPIVQNATVHAGVEEQTLDKKVIVFKYEKKKNYRRNIGHRQPITRIRIKSITGYQYSPAVMLP
ncbi:hypothetical protein Pfo_017318 [Paulownia fortunei]|nr:hypothetical protein Pfo_017318 [Paulownia fortunei]